MTSKINIVLLCAGKSSRLKFNLPKVILPINGKTLLQRSLHSLGKLSPSKTIIVAGFKKELVINLSKTLNYKNLNFVVQKEQLGTGHAISILLESSEFENDHSQYLVVIPGDVPLIRKDELDKLVNDVIENKAAIGLISACLLYTSPSPRDS